MGARSAMIEAILEYQFMQKWSYSNYSCKHCMWHYRCYNSRKENGNAKWWNCTYIIWSGVGLGYLMGSEPIIGAIGFSILSALGIGQ